MEACLVCSQVVATIHSHHTTPQAYGGKDSQQVPLCPTCHNAVHRHADALLAYRRSGGKSKVKSYYPTAAQEQNAWPLVQAIVAAASAEQHDKAYKMALELSADVYGCLRLLKKEFGFTSLHHTLTYCIKKVYQDRIGGNQPGEKRNGKSCNEMWGL